MKPVIIVASSRKDGNTNDLAQKLIELSGWDIINLLDYNISHFDYDHKNTEDDFLPLIEKLILTYDHFIFVTPVYWYSMSGVLKVFFDRFTDLLTIRKELGRKLKGKKMSVITTSTGDHLDDVFWIPFKETAQYLEMNFIATLHTVPKNKDPKALSDFVYTLKNC